ncbi:MAG: PD-(D/E)XK nuclease family protein, partial [Thermoguttaceae bacterium]
WTGKSLISDLQVKVTDAQPQIQGTASLKRARPRINKILDKVKKQMQNGESHRPRHLAPIAPDRSTRRQFSFSRLSGALHERSAPNLITAQQADDFFEPALDPLGLGTLVHAVLAEVDFSKPDDLARIVHRLAPLHLPEADGQLAEPMEMIGRFISSDRAAQIAAAREVYRELEFLLAWPPGSRDPNARFLQGFIDCLYCDSGGAWHLIDYKTNRVTAETMAQTAAEYEMQMFAYALATERILKTAPVELTLCFLRPGLEHHFLWNEQAKKSLIEKINQLLP